MRRPRSQAHTSVLALCVLGCLWVAASDERLPNLPKASISTEIQAASVETVQDQTPAGLPETTAPSGAPFAVPTTVPSRVPSLGRIPGPQSLERFLGNASGPVWTDLPH